MGDSVIGAPKVAARHEVIPHDEVHAVRQHLAAAIGNERLAWGEAVLFITAPDLLDYLRSSGVLPD